MLWAAVMLLSATSDRRWGDTQHGWQMLCAEWLLSQASGLVRVRIWEQKNIPCGPWGSWDAVSQLLVVYLHTGLAHASQTWGQANSSPCEGSHGSLWACVQDLEDAATNPIQIPFSSCLAEEVLKFPGYLLICSRAEVLEVVLNSTGHWAVLRERQNKQGRTVNSVVPSMEWLCIPV